ncbi:hypothetical protein [Thermosporothrix hazakensis]|jgi:hypothetical protein|nr:hypothetical protein [Thermosporothrix hazakensis]
MIFFDHVVEANHACKRTDMANHFPVLVHGSRQLRYNGGVDGR